MVWLLKCLAALFARLPLRAVHGAGAALGWAYGHVLRYHRRDSLDAVGRAFPERTPEQVRECVDRMYVHLGLNMVEFLVALGGRAEELVKRIEVQGAEHVEEALAKGNGALALVAHVGNWEYLALAMAQRFQPSGMIIKELKQGGLSDYFIERRRQQGILVFPRRGAYRSCLRALRANTLIGFVLDQNMMWKEGVFVDFFGRPACTTPGLAHLSTTANAPVIPMFIERLPNRRHRLVIQAPLPPPPSREPEVIHQATQQYTRIIEEAIRARPEQWIWIHRRWRTTPDKVEQSKRLKKAPQT